MGAVEIILVIFFGGLALGLGALPVLFEVAHLRVDFRESQERRAKQSRRF